MRVSQVLSLLIILLFGLLLLFVALTPVYDSFMHPRFRPLTLLGGYFMMALGMPVMLRGVALRREDLDKENRIALGRVFLSCCAADSVRLIFFVDVPEGFDQSLIKDSSWVVIKGRVSARPAKGTSVPDADGLSPDSFSTMDIVSTEYILKADEITATREPAIFFTDTLRNEEPYTF